jgi:hypothetical protein
MTNDEHGGLRFDRHLGRRRDQRRYKYDACQPLAASRMIRS